MAVKDFFSFSKSERIGAVFLIAGVLGLIAYRVYIDRTSSNPLPVEIRERVLDTAQALEERHVQKKEVRTSAKRVWSLQERVDLNYLSAKEMYGYGFSSQLVDAIFTYKRDSGMIKNPAALNSFQKVSSSELDSIKKYADFSRYVFRQKEEGIERVENTQEDVMDLTLDINSATAEEFRKIRGIGPVLSERIVKFRDALGGFYSVSQLKEVYGLKDSLIDANKNVWKLVTPHATINVQTSTVEELKHPYIDRKTAKAIVQYRDQHTPFVKEDLSKIYALDAETIEKITPYLRF